MKQYSYIKSSIIKRYYVGILFFIHINILLFLFFSFLSEPKLYFDSLIIFITIPEFLIGIFVFCLLFQIIFYFISNGDTKYLTITDSEIKIELFNGKIIKILFSEIQKIGKTNDIYKNFLITKNNGEVIKIIKSIKNDKEAYLLMQFILKK